jgi:flagellar protein FlbD
LISLTRLNRIAVIVNSDLIELIESTPDTVISMTTGEKIVVREAPHEIVNRIRDFRRSIYFRPEEMMLSPALKDPDE